MSASQVLIDLQYDAQAKTVALQKYNDDQQRIATVEVTNQFDIHCLIDTSSIEIFVNNGEACFSERIYSENDIRIETDSVSEKDTVRIYQLGGMM
jgi:beta-fructofuranosidase